MLFIIMFQLFLFTVLVYRIRKVKSKLERYLNTKKNGKEKSKKEKASEIWEGYYQAFGRRHAYATSKPTGEGKWLKLRSYFGL